MRLAEVIGALSFAADLSSGLAMEKGLRTVIVATRLARLTGLTSELADVFWVSALRLVGCLGFAHEEASFAAGDDNSLRKTLVYADFDQPLDVVGRVVRGPPFGSWLRGAHRSCPRSAGSGRLDAIRAGWMPPLLPFAGAHPCKQVTLAHPRLGLTPLRNP